MPLQPPNNKPLIVPIAHELKGQAELTLKNFGLGLLKPKFFTIDKNRIENEATEDLYNYDKKSIFGLPVFDTIQLNALTYEDFDGKTVNLGDFVLDIALVEVSNNANIVITPITGRNGSVKEYMSDGDYAINIKGSLVNPLANTPPAQLVTALNEFCKSHVEIKVNSTVLSYLKIFSIVILDRKFFQRQGARNVIDYELNCLSDVPIEIKIDMGITVIGDE